MAINVKGEPELSGDRLIGHDGSINFPLIGSVGVSGMKTTEVEKIIKQQLEDGFLQNAVVSVSTKDGSKANSKEETSVTEDSDEQILIELRDKKSDIGIKDSILCVGNKVYQTNRLGQVLVNKSTNNTVVIADGYKTLSGSLNQLVKSKKGSGPSYIVMEKIPIKSSITCSIIDANSHEPVKHAEINLDGRQFVANNLGVFKIKDNKREFSEVIIKKRGYKDLKKVIDYKSDDELTFELSK